MTSRVSPLRKFSPRALVALALTGLAPAAWAASTANAAFNPNTFVAQGTSVLTLTVSNSDTSGPVTVSASAPLNLPAGSGLTFVATPAPATTCTGLTVSAPAGGAALTLSGTGTVPKATSGTVQGTCTITATVTGSTQGTFTQILPSGFFTTSDGSNPPIGNGSNTVAVTPPTPVGVTLYSTNGNATSGSTSIPNSLYSNQPADFTAGMTRLRWVLTNNNPYDLTGVQFVFPAMPTINVIPDSLVSPNGLFSLDTTGNQAGRSGLYNAGSGPKATVGCGGTLAPALTYNLTPTVFVPGTTGNGSSTLGSITTTAPLTLTGATIPANTSCEVSFLARFDGGETGINSGVPTIAGGNNNVIAISIPTNAVTTSQSVGNSAQALSATTTYSNYSRIIFNGSAPTSGYAGSTTSITVSLNNGGNIMRLTPLTTVSPGLLYSVGVGIEPQLPVNSTTASCPVLPASAWDSVNRRLAFVGPFPGLTSCGYNIPFVASYAGSGGTNDPLYTNAQICAMPSGPDNIPGNADDGYVTTPGGLTYKFMPLVSCVTYRAVAGSAPATPVTIAAQLQNYTGANVNVGSTINAGDDFTMQLTLTAPVGSGGATNYRLTGSFTSFAILNSALLPYVPAISNTCGGALTATPGTGSVSITGVNLADGASCVIRLPVGNTTFQNTNSFNIQTCDAYGTIGGAQVCSPGVNLSYNSTSTYFNYTWSLSPTIVALPEVGNGTMFTLTLNKPAGRAPVENLPAAAISLAATSASTVNYGLQAAQILSNSCNATVNGTSGGAGTVLPAGISTLNLTTISTPDSQTQGQVVYSAASGQYDANAFKASGCTIALLLKPTQNTTTAGTTITSASSNLALSTNNGGVSQTGFAYRPGLSFTAIGVATPPTLGMSIAPGSVTVGNNAVLTITIDNSQGTPVDLTNASLTDAYPPGMFNASANANAAFTTLSGTACTGTATAANSGNSLTLSGATIPAGSKCALSVNVTTTSATVVNNAIAANALGSDQGLASNAVTAPLALAASVGAVLQFAPSSFNYDPNVPAHNASTLKLTITNAYGSAANDVNMAAFSLPAGMAFNGVATPIGGCALATSINTAAGTIAVTGGTVAAGGSCEIDFPVILSAAPATLPTQSYTITGTQVTSSVGSSTGAFASATLTVTPAATVSITKILQGSPAGTPTTGAGIPQSGYPVTLTCTNSGTFNLSINTASATTQPVQANDACTVTEGAPPGFTSAGYSWGSAIGYTPTGGSLTTAAGTAAGNSVTVSNTVIAGTNSVTLVNQLNPASVGGSLPALTLNCTPGYTGTGPFTITTGAQCTVSVSGAASAPGGYTVGATTFAGLGIDASAGTFTVPSGGGTVTATTALNLNPAQTLTVSSNVFSAGGATISGGTPPTPTLTCTPAATAVAAGSWTAPQGATCTLGVTGTATAPNGYALAGTTLYGGTGVNTSTGAFTVVNGGVPDLSVTTNVTALDQPVTVSGNAFSVNGTTGGTLPTVTLTCNQSVGGAYPNFMVPTGATCSAVNVSGASAPNGYALGTPQTTFGGANVNTSTGAFTVPAGGIANLTVTTNVTAQNQPVTLASVFDPAISGGTVPTVTLTCTPTAATGTYPNLQVPTGETCTISVPSSGSGAASAPAGYSAGTTTFAGSAGITVTGGNTFVVPASGGTITATTPLTAQAQTVNVSSVFDPAIAGGTAPTVTLTCTPTVATGTYPTLSVPTGETCTISVPGSGTGSASAPAGYSAGTTTFAGSAGITVTGGNTFVVPANGGTITATTPLTAQAQTINVASVFNPAITGGTVPTVTLTCSPTAATGTYPTLSVPTGETCTISVPGSGTGSASAPAGYSAGTTTFAGSAGITVTGGNTFVVPANGGTITATTPLTAQAQTINVSSVFNPAITGGTAPTVTLTCSPTAATGAYPTLSVPTGETCTISVPGSGTGAATAPAGYAAGATTFVGSGGITVTGGNTFVVPANGGTITATTALVPNPSQNVTLTNAFGVSGTTGGTLPTVTLTCAPAATETTPGSAWTAPAGAVCTLNATGASAPSGYTLGTTSFSGTGVSGTAYTVPTAGGTIAATTSLTENTSQTVTLSNVFGISGTTGGTLPTVALTCNPAVTSGTASASASSTWTVAAGASCTLSATNVTSPDGYTAGTTAFTGAGTSGANGTSYLVPSSGGTVTATTNLSLNASQTLTLSNVFDPNVTDSVSVLPTIALTCNPAATGLSAPTGASCTIGASNANAPNGYQLGTTTFTGSAITDTGTGAFVMPSGGFNLTVTTTLTENAGQAITLPANGNTFSANGSTITGGTLPTPTLTCSPAATVNTAGSAWTVPQGASCTLSVPASGTGAAVAPDGYALGTTTFGGTNIDPSAGTFSVPAGGIVNLTVTTALTAEEQPVSLAPSGGNVFVPAVSGGTLPTISLSCTPMETVVAAGSTWTAPTGAACQFQASGAEPPPGYTLGATTFDDGSGGGSSGSGSSGSDSSRLGTIVAALRSPKQASAVVDPATGVFIVPAGGVPAVVARTALLRLAPPEPVPFDGRWLVLLGGLLLAVGMGWRHRVKR